MLITGQLEIGDMMAAQWLHMRSMRIFIAIGLWMVLIFAVFAAGGDYIIAIIVCLIAPAIIFFVLVPIQTKRTFRQNKSLSEPMTIELREGGLFFKRLNGENLLPWSYVLKWRKKENLVLLYISRMQFYVIPKRFFSDNSQFQSLIGLLESKLGKPK